MSRVRLLLIPVALVLIGGGIKVANEGTPSPADRPGQAQIHCSRKLHASANVSQAIARARGGEVICLGKGTYGEIEATRVSKRPAVTVRSAAGARATVDGIDLTDSDGLNFVGLAVRDGVTVTPSGANLTFLGNDVTGRTGIYLFGDYRIGKRIEDVRIEGNRIHDIDYTGTQGAGYGYGIEGVGDVRGMTIRNNTIQSTASDYIQSATPVNWVVDRNTFLGPSLLADHEDHQDLWQIFGGGHRIRFTNNVARDTETQESLLFQEGAFSDVVVENNLFDHDSRGYTCQIYQSSGLIFRDNTVVGSHWGCLFRDLESAPPGSDYEVERNVFAETQEGAGISTEGRAGEWGTYDYNVSSDGSARGPHSLRHWKPSWTNPTSFEAQRLPFTAGYRAP